MVDDPNFAEGVALFNRGEFFDAHEVWEDLWHGYRKSDRPLLQGLIQLAAGFYHLQCDNEKGARSQLTKGLRKLGAFDDDAAGFRLADLCREAGQWLTAVEQGTGRPLEFPNISLIERQ